MFVEMEQVFRDTFPKSTSNINLTDYVDACCDNSVIQDCFFSATYSVENCSEKDKVFLNNVKLYFKIRVHHKCKTIIDVVRAKTKVSSKNKAQRSKLAK